MSSADFDPGAFRALIPSVSPSLLSDFLSSIGWELTERHEGLLEYWMAPDESDHSPHGRMLLLPLNEEMRDFERRLVESLAELAFHFNDDAPHLLERIDRLNWDTLVLRSDFIGREESMRLAEAAGILNAGMEMMRISALYTFNPHRTKWNNRSPKVSAYLDEGVRLGHTERGSFTFPIFSRIGARRDAEASFGRRVMSNLAQALERVHHWRGDGPREREDNSLFDLEIAKQLASIPHAPGGNLLSISFRWSPSRSLQADHSSDPLHFSSRSIEELKKTTRRLDTLRKIEASEIDTAGVKMKPPPPLGGWQSSMPVMHSPVSQDSVTFISGLVVSVGLDDRNRENEESPYFVVLRTDEGDVWIWVDAEDHAFALNARQNNQAVRAEGTVLPGDRKTLRGSLVRPPGITAGHDGSSD
ncbi:hypothetical protein [Streptomyces sp. NPDC127038]|uniref:hypothetical protein n=1 Tax=Streptomyces sp. NPDC127038 TaxID=3347114 RepID=UPI003647EDEA